MGVYITNIDLSKEQHLFIDGFGIVWNETKIGQTTVGKATEIKAPHGRLVDADKLCETLREISKRQKYDNLYNVSVAEITEAIIGDLKGSGMLGFNNAPTIIEAEE